MFLWVERLHAVTVIPGRVLRPSGVEGIFWSFLLRCVTLDTDAGSGESVRLQEFLEWEQKNGLFTRIHFIFIPFRMVIVGRERGRRSREGGLGEGGKLERERYREQGGGRERYRRGRDRERERGQDEIQRERRTENRTRYRGGDRQRRARDRQRTERDICRER